MKLGTIGIWIYLSIFTPTWYQGTTAQRSPINIAYQWKQLEFDYATEEDRQNAIDSGEFIPGYLAPIDVDVYYSGNNESLKFITVPRFQPGVPATVGTITDRLHDGNPVIAPYPSWSWHRNLTSCNDNRIVSVFRVKADECGRLWVLDNGILLGTRICPAQILAFDLKTNELVHRYEIPDDQLQCNSLPLTPIVDVRDPPPMGQCNDTFIYSADVLAFSLHVYDVQNGTSWRITQKSFYPDPNYGSYRIDGVPFELMDGLLGMDLSPLRLGEDRILYYHALSSGTENWVQTSYIRNRTLFADSPKAAPEVFHTYPRRRHTQCAPEAIDKDGISYFGLVSDTSVNCWNTQTEYGEDNIALLAQNSATLQFISGIKVVDNGDEQELWLISIRFQKIETGTINPNETNFRIHTAKINDLTGRTKCRTRPILEEQLPKYA